VLDLQRQGNLAALWCEICLTQLRARKLTATRTLPILSPWSCSSRDLGCAVERLAPVGQGVLLDAAVHVVSILIAGERLVLDVHAGDVRVRAAVSPATLPKMGSVHDLAQVR
jgi:hypothetical protein